MSAPGHTCERRGGVCVCARAVDKARNSGSGGAAGVAAGALCVCVCVCARACVRACVCECVCVRAHTVCVSVCDGAGRRRQYGPASRCCHAARADLRPDSIAPTNMLVDAVREVAAHVRSTSIAHRPAGTVRDTRRWLRGDQRRSERLPRTFTGKPSKLE